jgi:uncharacterized Zn finger protein (UPF0148 family)
VPSPSPSPSAIPINPPSGAALRVGLFDGGAKDRAQLSTALARLGPTDVAGLSAALNWAPNRTVRALRGLSDGTRYDPASGSVRPPEAPAPGPSPAPRVPGTGAPEPAAPVILGVCPECDGKLTTTGAKGTVYCAECGFLEVREPPAPSNPRTTATAPGGLDPRRAEELIAAWVTSQPILCPNCRQPLRHQGVESYTCPACGERVTFSETGVAAVPKSPA